MDKSSKPNNYGSVLGKAKRMNWLFYLILLIASCEMKAQAIQVDTFSIGSIGGSQLGPAQRVQAQGFRRGFYLGNHGLPKFGKCAIMSGNQPAFSVRLGKGSIFYFHGTYYEVLGFKEINKNNYHVDYFDCVELPEEPRKGHILNMPKLK